MLSLTGPAAKNNDALDAFREGKELGPDRFTVSGLIRHFEHDETFTKLAEKTQRDYSASLKLLAEITLPKRSKKMAEVDARTIKPRHADWLHKEVRKRGVRTGTLGMQVTRRMFAVARRRGWLGELPDNPFAAMELETIGGNTVPATREQVGLRRPGG